MATTEDLDVLDAEFTEEEEEALDAETALAPYERLETLQGILSDPAKAIAAFGGMAIDAVAIQFDDGRGKKHFALTAEGAKAVFIKADLRYKIHEPKFEEIEIEGTPWVRCIVTVTLLDTGSEVVDISERPRKDKYGNIDKFAGRSAYTSALARVVRTICAGTVGFLETFFTTCMNEGKVIVPGEAPDAIRTEVNRAQAGRAEERMGETPRIGPQKARDLQDRLGALYKLDRARFANLGRDLERLKKHLCGANVKLEKLPAEHLATVEEWLAKLEASGGQLAQTDIPLPEGNGGLQRVGGATEPEAEDEDDGEESFPDVPRAEGESAPNESPVDFGLSGALAAAREKGMSEEDIFAAKSQAGLLKGATEEGVKAFSKLVAAHRKKANGKPS